MSDMRPLLVEAIRTLDAQLEAGSRLRADLAAALWPEGRPESSRRASALALADVLTMHGFDVQSAAEMPEKGWGMVAYLARTAVPDIETRSAVRAILRDREANPDPFAGFVPVGDGSRT